MEEEINYYEQIFSDVNMRVRTLEEKQRMLKDRMLLIGENLLDIKEKNQTEILGLKKEMELMKTIVERMNLFMESLSKEISKFAKKEDIEILAKQAKMFQPLDLLKKEN